MSKLVVNTTVFSLNMPVVFVSESGIETSEMTLEEVKRVKDKPVILYGYEDDKRVKASSSNFSFYSAREISFGDLVTSVQRGLLGK